MRLVAIAVRKIKGESMKFSVVGFSQRKLVELGLGMDEAMILRWFVDYQASGKMRVLQFSGHTWYWVNYSGVLESLPIIAGSTKTISRRFDKLEAAGVLEHYTFREGGIFSCYRINPAVYTDLIDDIQQQRDQVMANTDTVTPTLFPLDQTPEKAVFECETNEGEGETELSNGKTDLSDHRTDLSEQKISLLDSSIKSKEPPISPTGGKAQKSRKRFIKPTIEEITTYCTRRNNGIDPQEFFDSNEAKGWVVGRNRTPMQDWQATIRVWEASRRRNGQSRAPDKKRVNQGWEGNKGGRVRL